MDHSRPPRSIGDDAAFLSRLDELERGLGPADGPHNGERPHAREGSRRGDRPTPEDRDDDTIGFLTDAIFEGHEPVAPPPGLPRARRPEVDLFPPARVDGQRPRESFLTPASAPAPAPIVARDAVPAVDPKSFYPAGSHARALSGMLAAIEASEGVVVLTGRAGVGKTIVCRAVARALDRRTVQSLILEPPQSLDLLLQTVLVDFGVVSRADLAHAPRVQREELVATLAAFLKSLASLRATAVIVIDDAHTMPGAVLEALAGVLPNLDSRLVQIVLAGAPELAPAASHAGLHGRSGVHLELEPLAEDEIADYVRHRIQVVDTHAAVDFAPEACTRIYQLSRGVPREVNLLSERALGDRAAGAAGTIDAPLIDRAAAALDFAPPADAPPRIARRSVVALGFIALLLVAAAVAAWLFGDAAIRAFSQAPRIPAALDMAAGYLPPRFHI